ncbi:MAG: hypothetical protein EOO42_01150 [Flavobacteriales bacterium]|nr:MAG: hypothetical protein EOO42_01150 [Flavobacteriales bacterium]
MDNLNLDVNLNIDEPQVKSDTDKVKKDIEGVGASAEASAKKVGDAIERISKSNQELLDKYSKNAREAEALYKSKNPQAAASSVTSAVPDNNLKEVASEVLNLKKANDENNKSQEDGSAILEGLSLETFTWTGLISLAASLVALYKEEIIEWAKSLWAGKEANEELEASQAALNEALGSGKYKDAIANVVELKQQVVDSKNGFIDKSKVVDHYNETMGKTAGVVKTVDEVQRKLTENGDAYIQMVLNQAAANIVLEEAATKAAEAEQRKLNGPNFKDYVSSSLKNIATSVTTGNFNNFFDRVSTDAQLYSTIDAAKLKNESKEGIELYKKLTAQNDEFAKKNGLNIFGDNKVEKIKDQSKQILDERKSLIKQLEAIDAEYTRKGFTKDDEELQALRDKFTKIRNLVLEFNKANPTKAISLVSLGVVQDQAELDLKYRQDTNRLKTALDEQKKLYDDFEKYKADLGTAKAKERYASQIDTEKTLLQQLEIERGKLLTIDPQNMSGAQTERLQELDKRIKVEEAAERKQFEDSLKNFQTYAQKRLNEQEKYSKIAADLRAQGENAAAQEAINKGLEEVTKLDEANIKKWDSYKRLFDNVEKLTRKQTLVLIAELEKELTATNITAEARLDVQKKINNLKSNIEKGSGKDIKELANDLARVANEFGSINGNIGNIAQVLLKSASAYVEIQKGIADIKDPGKSTADKIGAGLGIAGAAVGVVTSVVGYFKGLKEAKIKAQKELDDFYAKAQAGELNYQSLLRDRERDDAAASAKRLSGMLQQYELLKKQTKEIDNQYMSVLRQLQAQGEGEITGAEYKHGTWLRKARTDYTYGSLAGKDYDQLEQLYTQGRLADGAKALFEQLRKLKEEGADVNKTLAEIAEQAKEIFTGTTADQLTNSLLEMFKSGKTGVADLAAFFKDTMNEAALSVFKNKVLAANMDKFYEEFAKKAQSDDSVSESEALELEALFNTLTEDAKKKFEDLKKVTGLKLDNSSSSNSLSGAFKSASQDSINILAGYTAGARLAMLEGNAIAKQSAQEQMVEMRSAQITRLEIAANTLRTADNTEPLGNIDANIARMAKAMGTTYNPALAAAGQKTI